MNTARATIRRFLPARIRVGRGRVIGVMAATAALTLGPAGAALACHIPVPPSHGCSRYPCSQPPRVQVPPVVVVPPRVQVPPVVVVPPRVQVPPVVVVPPQVQVPPVQVPPCSRKRRPCTQTPPQVTTPPTTVVTPPTVVVTPPTTTVTVTPPTTTVVVVPPSTRTPKPGTRCGNGKPVGPNGCEIVVAPPNFTG